MKQLLKDKLKRQEKEGGAAPAGGGAQPIKLPKREQQVG